MTRLYIDDLYMNYSSKGEAAVNNISIEVPEGSMLVLLGASGCGKTTLLRCVAGLEQAQRGRIRFGDRTVFDADTGLDVPTHKRDIGLVFQNYSLWPHMTVQQNVEYPLSARGMPRSQRVQRSSDVLDVVQCRHLAERLPSMLSGGQQQRIALARALAPEPELLLLDEPLSNLDAVLRVELRAQLRSIHQRLGFTGIYVTHDQSEAFALGSQVAVLSLGQIEQLGPPSQVYLQPATEYVAEFLGIRNKLAVWFDQIWMSEAGPVGGDLGVFTNDKAKLNMYVRPEKIGLSAGQPEARPGWITLSDAQVLDFLYGGGEVEYHVRAGAVALTVKVPGAQQGFAPGQSVTISIHHDDLLFYADKRLVTNGG